jgi:hypothetical protein
MNHIKDKKTIDYLKAILITAEKRCVEQNLSTPEMFAGHVQLIANEQHAKNPEKPKVEVGLIPLEVGKGQKTTVNDLVFTIDGKSITSYFVVKNTAEKGVKLTQDDLTAYRPDVAASRIAKHLADPQANPLSTSKTLSEPKITPVSLPEIPQTATTLNLAQQLIQDAQAKLNQQPQPSQGSTTPLASKESNDLGNSLGNSLLEMMNASNQQPQPKETQEEARSTDTQEQNPDLTPTNPNVARLNKLCQSIRKNEIGANQFANLFKELGGQQQYNALSLTGDVIKIVSNLAQGGANGIEEERMNQIRNRVNAIEAEDRKIKNLMVSVGASLEQIESIQPAPQITSEPISEIVDSPWDEPESTVSSAVSPPPEPIAKTKIETEPKSTQPETAIDRLLKSNASIEQKLTAIEETLDRQLEELIATRELLEAIQESIERSQPEQEATETIVDEVETQEITSEQIDAYLIDVLGSVDPKKVNQHLQKEGFIVTANDDKTQLTIKEIDMDAIYPIYSATLNDGKWEINSEISDNYKTELIDKIESAMQLTTQDKEQSSENERQPSSQPELVA